MTMLRILSCACSVALLPIALLGGLPSVLSLFAVNFVAFHAIWILPTIRGTKLTQQFFEAEMRLPLALFMICGMLALWLALPKA